MVERWNSCRSLPSSAVRAGLGGLGRVRPRRLRRVADDRPRRGLAAAADHPPLHRGEVLRLVDQDVGERVVLEPVRRRRPGPAGRRVLAVGGGQQLLHVDAALEQRGLVEVALVVGALGYVAERVAQLVDQRHVLDGQASTSSPLPPPHDLASSRCSSWLSRPSETWASRSGSRSQPSTVRASSGGHQADHEVEELVVTEQVVVERLPAPVEAALAADLAPQRVEQRPGHPRQLPVAPALRHQLPADPAERAALEGEHVVAPEDAELVRAARRLQPRRPPQQRRHPGRALDVGDRRLVVAGRADAVDDLAQGAQRHRGLAEAGQHPLDVAHEDPAGADHQHAAALVAAPVGVEEVGRRGAARPRSCRCPGRR